MNRDWYDHCMRLQPREEILTALEKKIKGMFKNNKHLLKEEEVKELIEFTKNLATQFDQITIYAFTATELRDHHRRKAGLL
jgi:hypothetical protein